MSQFRASSPRKPANQADPASRLERYWDQARQLALEAARCRWGCRGLFRDESLVSRGELDRLQMGYSEQCAEIARQFDEPLLPIDSIDRFDEQCRWGMDQLTAIAEFQEGPGASDSLIYALRIGPHFKPDRYLRALAELKFALPGASRPKLPKESVSAREAISLVHDMRELADKGNVSTGRVEGEPSGDTQQAAVDGVFTVKEFSRLAGIEPKTLLNKISTAKKGRSDQPPAPVVPRSGRKAAQYRYAALRTWYSSVTPGADARLPETVDGARKALSAQVSIAGTRTDLSSR